MRKITFTIKNTSRTTYDKTMLNDYLQNSYWKPKEKLKSKFKKKKKRKKHNHELEEIHKKDNI